MTIGLLTKATGAKNTANESEIGEKIRLAYQDYYLGQHTNPGYSFQDALNSIFGTGVAKATGPDSNGIYTVSVNGKKYDYDIATGTAGEHVYVDPFDYGTGKTKETVDVGDTISIGNEHFIVFKKNVTKIKAIAQCCIQNSTNNPVQNVYEGPTAFSTTNYWTQGVDEIDMDDSRNNIQQYINAYKTTLENLGAENIEVRVPRYSELNVSDVINNVLNKISKSFWLGSSDANSSDKVYAWTESRGTYYLGTETGTSSSNCGVVPVIIINR